jgi:predicted phage terminase large subunit-like protein
LAQEHINWVHLNIPMEHEVREYVNGFGDDGLLRTFWDEDAEEIEDADVLWRDPRGVEGELAWPERFTAQTVEDLKIVLGPTMTAAQLQQRPIPRGGAIIRSEWWQPWPEEPFPPLDFLICSVDTAYTEDKKADPSAATYWGLNHDQFGNPRIFLLWAWQEWLELHQLVEKLIDSCQIDNRKLDHPRFPVHRVLLEDAASGKSVGQEIARILMQRATFGVDLIKPLGDKTSRMYSVEPTFSQKLVYAHNRTWAAKVIDQCASMPYTTDDHLADSTAQGIRWLRDCGYAPTREEVQQDYVLERMFRPKPKPLYPV